MMGWQPTELRKGSLFSGAVYYRVWGTLQKKSILLIAGGAVHKDNHANLTKDLMGLHLI
jgi:hypothetical protein